MLNWVELEGSWFLNIFFIFAFVGQFEEADREGVVTCNKGHQPEINQQYYSYVAKLQLASWSTFQSWWLSGQNVCP